MSQTHVMHPVPKTYYKPTAYLLAPEASQSGGFTTQSGRSESQSGGSVPKEGGSEPSENTDFCELTEELEERIKSIGGRGSSENVRIVILELCFWRPLMPAEIAKYLNRKSVQQLVELRV